MDFYFERFLIDVMCQLVLANCATPIWRQLDHLPGQLGEQDPGDGGGLAKQEGEASEGVPTFPCHPSIALAL